MLTDLMYRVILDAGIRRFQLQRCYLRAVAALRWINSRFSVLQGQRPQQRHSADLHAVDVALQQVRGISDLILRRVTLATRKEPVPVARPANRNVLHLQDMTEMCNLHMVHEMRKGLDWMLLVNEWAAIFGVAERRLLVLLGIRIILRDTLLPSDARLRRSRPIERLGS